MVWYRNLLIHMATISRSPRSMYVAFLRGINVGGKVLVKMTDVKKIFESLSFKHVQTVLASGNIIFETDKRTAKELASVIEEALVKKYERPIGVLVRTVESLQKIFEQRYFKDVEITPATRCYVTFLSETPTSKLKIPYSSPEKDFTILAMTGTELVSVLTLGENRGTVDAMAIIEKEFGKKVTTRNWNTIEKILRKCS